MVKIINNANSDYVILPVPKQLLIEIGWYDNYTEFEVMPYDNGFIIQPKSKNDLDKQNQNIN